ncbi:MAG: type I-C CRISPR-associated protein Cas7/Csd2 [Christensenellales bacterium]|jgi:CRISPR-associated protein Csd2
MTKFDKKVDFAVLFTVRHANPNGDPLNGNRPRENYDGMGEVSDVCLKRKIRNRLQDMGEKLFVQSNDRSDDGLTSLRKRADNLEALRGVRDADEYAKIACKEWIDVRSFGQVFAFSGDSLSVGARGPVSIHPAFSVAPVEVESLQITKSVNSEDTAGRASDTMGTKHRINFGLYVFYGSINCQLAEKTGFSQEDAEKIHEALRTLFENDASSARPDGSMEVRRVLWWQHNCASGQYPSAKVHRSLQVQPLVDTPAEYEDFRITVTPLPDLACQDEQFD